LDEHFDFPPESVWQSASVLIAHPPPPPFESKIMSDFPETFANFRRRHFNILWRSTHDGFKVKEFHSRCDGHANTLTVILDRERSIFGGFTPVKWKSRVWNGKHEKEDNCPKVDDSQKSFRFTLRNPHHVPERRFPLRAEMKQEEVFSFSEFCPAIGDNPTDLIVSDDCNANTHSFHSVGLTYTNCIGLNGRIVLTASGHFQVKEIEVFEITE
jgi:hypothetical protein